MKFVVVYPYVLHSGDIISYQFDVWRVLSVNEVEGSRGQELELDLDGDTNWYSRFVDSANRTARAVVKLNEPIELRPRPWYNDTGHLRNMLPFWVLAVAMAQLVPALRGVFGGLEVLMGCVGYELISFSHHADRHHPLSWATGRRIKIIGALTMLFCIALIVLRLAR